MRPGDKPYTEREEETAKLSEKWFNECRDQGFTPAEAIAAAAHMIFQQLSQVENLERASMYLTEIYTMLLRRLIKHPFKARP